MNFISKRAVILGVVASLGFAGTAQAETMTPGRHAHRWQRLS